MNTSSAYRNNSSAGDTTQRRILVWDAPVRLFHWLFAACFAGAWLTAESEHWRLVHVALGYTAGGLVIFRMAWGLVGTKYARFSSFVCGPTSVWKYLLGILLGHPQRHVGHNPAGAVVIVTMLALACALTMTGWATYNDVGGNWLGEVHEVLASLMLALVAVHVAGVIVSSRLHRENLVGAMLSGYKTGHPDEGIRRAWKSVAAIMLAGVLAFWWWQWQVAPAPIPPGSNAATSHQTDRDDAD
ncbi:cytochrome b/b6 domain-containing protein [Paraburkholderia caribensis]|jgi:cytochrome b|uniref:cytochrome b/b6 domain-containing protein n=1 Tax=Paraburkholderia caribensis TaxID=75105 RepID=UPI00071F8F8A|nr:cytochrome b/b6 domain-containing protein [Paraburkholderia caribensis]ALP67158.1 cytochrome B [Paraburkholderia caribensis]AUT56870.1 cytochrome B [Paraburkholderia caribensis]